MSKSLQERIAENKRVEARGMFAGYVQSVAFNMTLSRNMVDMLGVVRESQCAKDDFTETLRGRRVAAYGPNGTGVKDHVASHSVPLLHSLIRRGLVVHNSWDGPMNKAPESWRWYELTRAGELMCDLLVEAGLLSAQAPQAKRKRA